MKKTLSLIIAIAFSLSIYAQAPQSFAYQGIARNNSGNPIANQLISIRASILDATSTGTSQYTETQSVTTNSLGLFSVSIGMGTAQTGTFSAVTWATGLKFMKVEFDPAGGTSYVLSGTQQILSVPYALNALNAKTYVAGVGVSVSGSTITNTAPNQTVTLVPNGATTITGSYPTYTISSPITPTVSLVGSGSTSVTGTYPTFTVTSPRMVAGTSSGGFSPTMVTGGGFTVTRVAQGIYDVVFTTPFTTTPTIVNCVHYNTAGDGSDGTNYFSKVYLKTANGFRINTAVPAGNIDTIGFSIIATGN